MKVLGAQQPDWSANMLITLNNLRRLCSCDLGEFASDDSGPGAYRLVLDEGSQILARVSAEQIEISLISPDGQNSLRVVDKTLALDDEDLGTGVIDETWLRTLLDRWVDLAVEFENIDPRANPKALFQAFDETDCHLFVDIFEHVEGHHKKSGHEQQMEMHLVLPTDYWNGRIVSTDAENKHYLITEDDALDAKIEALPMGCEITGLEDGEFGFEFRPIHFTPVRING
ncbi:hypothetical protein [Erythrobacter aureus]|uniref:Uncharacterized protein n=1 Tax=Erythrobacter aureus TaxID=2182384 RepID=A0A345YJA4_9SPHN|nr:hypothetical protein [Erythrobacter aureus]AXK44006.1 hypothetical protein DVR09_16260 [Erythrobacter aureus]